MKRISLITLLAVIIFAPSSFAASLSSPLPVQANDLRTSFEMQEVKKALTEAEQARSEAVLDQRILEIAGSVAAQDSSIDQQGAIDEVVALVDGEQWVDSSVHRFDIIQSLLRSQGLTISDTGEFFYSGEFDILRTKTLLGDAVRLFIEPIPHFLSKLGDNHVGDIDAAGGKLYVSIEDGPKYKNPHVGVYGGKNLGFEKEFHLSPVLQPDGVPWVAVDPAKNMMYSSSYRRPTAINAYDMTTGKVLPQIPISMGIPNVQGAKVAGGMMYAACDGSAPDPKAVYKINLATGTVMLVYSFTNEISELEGLAIDKTGGQVALDVMGIGYGSHKHTTLNKRSELHFLKLKTTSLRDQLRQKLATP